MHQVLERPSKSVHRPRSDHVESPSCCVLEHLIEGGAPDAPLRTANPRILVYVSNDRPSALGYFLKLSPLVSGGLLARADA
jgi:hypothetical protein